MMGAFEFEEVFDEDYFAFYDLLLTDERSDTDTDLISTLGPVAAGDRVLDLACGHGRISNRLAARVARVTGYDLTPAFLDRGRAEAAAKGLQVDYVKATSATSTTPRRSTSWSAPLPHPALRLPPAS